MSLSKDFVWGAATAAFQIEGAYNEGGRGPSIWDSPYSDGHVVGNMNGNVATDHYHRYKEDVALMQKMGLKNYRFSVSWSRLINVKTGEINEDGKKFYLDLVKELKNARIEPWVTIYHWDLPIEYHEKGGFLWDGISDVFASYAATVVDVFGDSVKNYFIFNEPQCVIEEGYVSGNHAPFLRLPRKEVFKAAHNVLLCIGKAEKAMRKIAGHKLNLGFSPCFAPAVPTDKRDEKVVEEYQFTPNGEFYDGCYFTDAVIKGKFPDNYKKWFDENDYHPSDEDLKIIKCDLDFFGFNFYRGFFVKNTENGIKRLPVLPTDDLTAMDWQVTPEAIEYVAKYYYERYRLPLIVAENGVAISEWKTLDGSVPDYMRIDYMKRHIDAIKKIAEKYSVIGYFYWTLLDNFEWSLGYTRRFGLIYVDYKTQERTLKKSAYWYKKVIETNGETDFEV